MIDTIRGKRNVAMALLRRGVDVELGGFHPGFYDYEVCCSEEIALCISRPCILIDVSFVVCVFSHEFKLRWNNI